MNRGNRGSPSILTSGWDSATKCRSRRTSKSAETISMIFRLPCSRRPGPLGRQPGFGLARPRPSKVLRVYSPQEGSCFEGQSGPEGEDDEGASPSLRNRSEESPDSRRRGARKVIRGNLGFGFARSQGVGELQRVSQRARIRIRRRGANGIHQRRGPGARCPGASGR